MTDRMLGWNRKQWMFATYCIRSAPVDAHEALAVIRWFRRNDIVAVEWAPEDWPSEFIMNMYNEIIDDLFKNVFRNAWFLPAHNATIVDGRELT